MFRLEFLTRSWTFDKSKQPADVPKGIQEQGTTVTAESSSLPSSLDESAAAHENNTPAVPPNSPQQEPALVEQAAQDNPRRMSWRPFTILNGNQDRKPTLSASQEHEKKVHAQEDFTKRVLQLPSADRRAKESALIVRSLIIGPSSIQPANLKAQAAPSRPQLAKVKTQLLGPKSANRVIAHLRSLPSDPLAATTTDIDAHTLARGPIHAVCLPYTDAAAHERHFTLLGKQGLPGDKSDKLERPVLDEIVGVTTASISQLAAVFSDIAVVNLVSVSDFGLGHPGDAPGLLSGAIPTAETVLSGIEQITPQLMSLGYATGKAVFPDHASVYPPTDRMSVITYWWGLEIVLPPPTLVHLANVPSVAHETINFLTALSVVSGGVREILPFVRYISQYIDFEFNTIKKEDRGKGVVCAATWIMPAALVPRPWDFPQPIVPAPETEPAPTPEIEPTPAPTSPTSPIHRPTSPTLLPPVSAPEVTTPPNTAPPVDATPVKAVRRKDVPELNVTPPTPPDQGEELGPGNSISETEQVVLESPLVEPVAA